MHSVAVSWFGRIGPLACALVIAGIAAGSARVTHASGPADTLYGGGPQHIVTVDQNDGSITPLAPRPDFIFLALAFDSAGRLFAAGCDDSLSRAPCELFAAHLLMELDPLTGEIVDTIGPVTDASGSRLVITALSVQPETDVLFGFSVNLTDDSARIWTIDKSTAIATLVAPEVPAGCFQSSCSVRGEFAFAPDGTLYHIFVGGFSRALMTIDPSTGAELTSVPIRVSDYHGLAVRSDGVIFSTDSFWTCRTCPTFIVLMTIDPLTGAVTEVGTGEGENPVLGLDFSQVVIESVDIDIKPGSESNAVNPSARGILPVAILGSDTFDVADVDATTLTFGPGEAAPLHSSGGHAEDVNGDGYTDWVTHYRIEEVEIAAGDTELCLTGETLDGIPFEG